MKKIYINFFLSALLLSMPVLSTGSDRKQKSKNAYSVSCNHIINGNYQKYPKSFIKDGVPQGILIDILNYVGARMGCKFRYELNPWKRSYTNMIKGRGGIMGLSINSERMKIIDYSDTIYYDDLMIVVIKGKEFDYKSMNDLIGKRIISTRGASYGDKWEKLLHEKKIELVEDGGKFAQRIELLLRDRADAAIIGPGTYAVNEIIEKSEFLKKNRDKIVILKTPLKRDSNHIGFHKSLNKRAFLKKFNKHLAEGFKDGVFQSFIDKYNSQNHKK